MRLSLVMLGAVVATAALSADDQVRDAVWVEQRITAWQPIEEERAFDKIGWVSTLLEAEALAKQQNRAIFLFTYDGADLAGHRC